MDKNTRLYLFELHADMDARKHQVECCEFVVLSSNEQQLLLLNPATSQQICLPATTKVFAEHERIELSKLIRNETRKSFASTRFLSLQIWLSCPDKIDPYKYKDFILAICKTEIWLCRKKDI